LITICNYFDCAEGEGKKKSIVLIVLIEGETRKNTPSDPYNSS